MTLLSAPAFQNAWGGNRAGGGRIDGVNHTLKNKPKEHHARTRAINERQKRLSELKAERTNLSKEADAVINRILRQKRSIEIRDIRLGKYDDKHVGKRVRLVDRENREALVNSENRAIDALNKTVREGRGLKWKLNNVKAKIRYEGQEVSQDIIEEIHLNEKIVWKNASLKDLHAEAVLARNEKALEQISIIESLHSARDILKKIGSMAGEDVENLKFTEKIEIHSETKKAIATIKKLAQAKHISPSLKETLNDLWPDLEIGLRKSMRVKINGRLAVVNLRQLGTLVHESMYSAKFMLDEAAVEEFETALGIMVKSQN